MLGGGNSPWLLFMQLFRSKHIGFEAMYELISSLPIRVQKALAKESGVYESDQDDFAYKLIYGNKVESVAFSIILKTDDKQQ